MHAAFTTDTSSERPATALPLDPAPARRAASPPCPIRYEIRLVEESVIRAVRGLPAGDQRLFHRQREAVYDVADRDERDALFAQVHRSWFSSLGLHRPLDQALTEAGELRQQVGACRVAWAGSRGDELADLFDQNERPAHDRSKVILVRLRAEALLDPKTLLCFLRHEFQHLVDMLDPAFGYQKRLPVSDAGPSYDNILRNRYRVVWDTTIDGRLSRRGFEQSEVRQVRSREFGSTFPMLGVQVDDEFARWFDDDHPTHERLVAFALDPTSAGGHLGDGFAGRCPICLFPTAVLDRHPERLTEGARRELKADHPGWSLTCGLCSQCADLYLARHGDRSHPFVSAPLNLSLPKGTR
jgi:hypothetical protein